MTLAKDTPPPSPPKLSLPDHTQLPESNGEFVKNFQEHPQSILLTSSIIPVLQQLHPDGNFAIGQDSGIYWRLTDPPEKGAEAPDWFYVPNVPPRLDGDYRRSYVLWQESVAPLIAIEFVSGDGSEERDVTPASRETQTKPGKFWVYEQAIRIPFYAIYEVKKAAVEVYELRGSHYQRLQPNAAGRYPIPPLGVELGIWQGKYLDQNLPWLRWWDSTGNLLLEGGEQAKVEAQRAELEAQRANQATQEAQQERQRAAEADQRAAEADQRAERAAQEAQQERQRATELAAKLRALGIDPDTF